MSQHVTAFEKLNKGQPLHSMSYVEKFNHCYIKHIMYFQH